MMRSNKTPQMIIRSAVMIADVVIKMSSRKIARQWLTMSMNGTYCSVWVPQNAVREYWMVRWFVAKLFGRRNRVFISAVLAAMVM